MGFSLYEHNPQLAVLSGEMEARTVIEGEQAEGRLRQEAMFKEWWEGGKDKHGGSWGEGRGKAPTEESISQTSAQTREDIKELEESPRNAELDDPKVVRADYVCPAGVNHFTFPARKVPWPCVRVETLYMFQLLQTYIGDVKHTGTAW